MSQADELRDCKAIMDVQIDTIQEMAKALKSIADERDLMRDMVKTQNDLVRRMTEQMEEASALIIIEKELSVARRGAAQ
jgi:hypothetical protein